MTSDHIEKLIDGVRVNDGVYAVFFANNGGREAFQMYVVSAIADWGGVGFNFRALKYATILEGMLTIIASFWVAKTVIGTEIQKNNRQLGNWVGLGGGGAHCDEFMAYHVIAFRAAHCLSHLSQ